MTYIADSPKDYKYKVAQGEISGASTVNKFAFNPDIDSASEEVIANFGGGVNIMTTADTLDIVSTSGQDAVGGTGCSFILISGIGSGSLYQEEYVTLTGTTAVTTVNTWLGVNRVVAITTGTDDANAGDITAEDTTGTVGIQAQITTGESVTQQLIYHTQIGYDLLLDWLWFNVTKISGGSSPKVTVRGISYSRVTDTNYEIFRTTIDSDVENAVDFTPSQPFPIGGREVIYFVADTDTNNTEVVGRFSGIEAES